MISFDFKKLVFCATLVSYGSGSNLLCSNDSLEDAIVDDAQRKNLNVVQNIKNSRLAKWVEQNPRISLSGALNAAQAAVVLVLGFCVLRTKSKTSKANVEAAKANGDRDLAVTATATSTRLAGEATAATALINEKLGRLGTAGAELHDSPPIASEPGVRVEVGEGFPAVADLAKVAQRASSEHAQREREASAARTAEVARKAAAQRKADKDARGALKRAEHEAKKAQEAKAEREFQEAARIAKDRAAALDTARKRAEKEAALLASDKENLCVMRQSLATLACSWRGSNSGEGCAIIRSFLQSDKSQNMPSKEFLDNLRKLYTHLPSWKTVKNAESQNAFRFSLYNFIKAGGKLPK